MTNFYKKVLQITRQIPCGKVASYGQIAGLVSSPRAAIAVGQALHNLLNQGFQLPWHRVINSQGFISTTCVDHPAWLQKAMLEKEGIKIYKKQSLWCIDLEKYLWRPQAGIL